MSQELIQAQIDLIIGDYDKSAEGFENLLKTEQNLETQYQLLILLSICKQHQQKYQEAFDLCQQAIQIQKQNPLAYIRQSQTQFSLKNYQQALELSNTALQLQTEKTNLYHQIINLINKTQAILKNKYFDKNCLPQQSATLVVSQTGKVAYTWFQTHNKIVIEIQHQIENQNTFQAQINEQQIDLSFPIENNILYNIQLDLFDKIIPSKSEKKFYINKIEVILYKLQENLNWNFLEKQEKLQETQSFVPIQKQVYPTSGKVKKNWEVIEHEVDEDWNKNKQEYGDDDPNWGIFKKIYGNANEDTKKAMIKSMQESGGTVLSTDWKDVKNKDYKGKDRVSPPKGQQWANWDK